MARGKKQIKQDLARVEQLLCQSGLTMKQFEALARRRNELLIELCQARMPVYRQRDEISVKQSTYRIIKHL